MVRLLIGEEVIEFPKSEAGIAALLQTVDQKALSRKQIVSHLLVDEVAVYDDYEDYLLTNLNRIRTIQPEFLSLAEFMRDILVSVSEYLQGAIPAVEQLADAFYRQADSVGWQQLDQLIEGVQWLGETFALMDALPNLADLLQDYESWNLYAQALRELQEAAANLSEPLTFTDQVAVGDIMRYEVKPAMEKLNAAVPLLK